MVHKKKTIEACMARLMAEIIIEDDLPIHMDIGKSSEGCIDILLSYNPEDEHAYQLLIEAILEPIYSL